MTGDTIEFYHGAIRPVECIKDGWALISDRYWFFLAVGFVGIFVGSLAPFGILLGPAMCGIYLCLLGHARRKTVEFRNLFDGFDYFAQSLIATLIMMAASMILILPVIIVFFVGMISLAAGQPKHGQSDLAQIMPFISLGFFMFIAIMIISVVVQLGFFFTYPLIVDRKLDGWDAVKVSFRAGMANFWGLAGLLVLSALMSTAGVFCCYVGAILVIPITLAANAIAYQRVFEGPPAEVHV